jgi:chorismate mutase
MERVIRVLLLVNTDREASEIEFQYLRGTDALRKRVVEN